MLDPPLQHQVMAPFPRVLDRVRVEVQPSLGVKPRCHASPRSTNASCVPCTFFWASSSRGVWPTYMRWTLQRLPAGSLIGGQARWRCLTIYSGERRTANIYKMATTYFNSSFTYCPYCCLEHVPNQIEAAEESGQSESIWNQYDFLVGIGVGLLWFLIGLGNIFFFPWLCMLGGSAWFWTKSNIFRFVHVQTHFSALRSALQRTHVEYILRSNYLHIIT